MDLDATFRWALRLPRATEEAVGHFLSSLSPQMERALWYSGIVCLSLVVSHLAAVLYIAVHDVTGKWDRYSLKYQRSTWWTYAQHAPSFFFDVVFLLAPALLIFGYYYDAVLFAPLCPHGDWRRDGVRIVALFVAAIINNVINRLWAMAVHWLMHESKLLYRFVHKRHHCQIRDLCALAAWQDTTLEFILMEVFGVFLFAQLFNPLPWHFHVLLASYNGIGGAIDHSTFYVPGTLIDGRYHWDHHLRIDYNFSEMEFLDRMFGSLYYHTNTSLSLSSFSPSEQPQSHHLYKEGHLEGELYRLPPRLRRKQKEEEQAQKQREERVESVPIPDSSAPEEEQFRPSATATVRVRPTSVEKGQERKVPVLKISESKLSGPLSAPSSPSSSSTSSTSSSTSPSSSFSSSSYTSSASSSSFSFATFPFHFPFSLSPPNGSTDADADADADHVTRAGAQGRGGEREIRASAKAYA